MTSRTFSTASSRFPPVARRRAIPDAGRPSNSVEIEKFSLPNPTSATSLMRTCEPSGFILSRMFSRSEEHTSELQSLMRTSYAVFCLKKKKQKQHKQYKHSHNTRTNTI